MFIEKLFIHYNAINLSIFDAHFGLYFIIVCLKNTYMYRGKYFYGTYVIYLQLLIIIKNFLNNDEAFSNHYQMYCKDFQNVHYVSI